MANHVDNYIEVIGNDAAKVEFERIFQQIDSCEFQSLYDAEFLPVITETGKVGIDTVGAKWANLEDFGEDYALVTSAWSAVLPFLDELGCHLEDFDPKVQLTCQFTDEGYNFVGCALFHDSDVESDEEYYDDLVELRCLSLGEENTEDYDIWEDEDWYDFIDTRIELMKNDLLECAA
jgi:hypothetical protein